MAALWKLFLKVRHTWKQGLKAGNKNCFRLLLDLNHIFGTLLKLVRHQQWPQVEDIRWQEHIAEADDPLTLLVAGDDSAVSDFLRNRTREARGCRLKLSSSYWSLWRRHLNGFWIRNFPKLHFIRKYRIQLKNGFHIFDSRFCFFSHLKRITTVVVWVVSTLKILWLSQKKEHHHVAESNL